MSLTLGALLIILRVRLLSGYRILPCLTLFEFVSQLSGHSNRANTQLSGHYKISACEQAIPILDNVLARPTQQVISALPVTPC